MARSGRCASSIETEIAQLRGLDLKGLRARWKAMLGRAAPLHLPRHLLFGILAYRIQADVLGDLDKQTIQLLKRIGSAGSATDVAPAVAAFDQRRRDLLPGTVLTREWNGRSHHVVRMSEGFGWEGRTYDSLSSIAFAITGTKWNGPRFFGLRDKTPIEIKE
jgi:hypothetical protein